MLRHLFHDAQRVVVHDPLPLGPTLSDEGAANHCRLATSHAAPELGVLLNDTRRRQLEAWVDQYYRDELRPQDLADPQLLWEVHQALDVLTQLLSLGSIYPFQRVGA